VSEWHRSAVGGNGKEEEEMEIISYLVQLIADNDLHDFRRDVVLELL
jgi:hypothetical protein